MVARPRPRPWLALGVSGTPRVGGAHAGRDADAARCPELRAERQRALLGDGRRPAATARSGGPAWRRAQTSPGAVRRAATTWETPAAWRGGPAAAAAQGRETTAAAN